MVGLFWSIVHWLCKVHPMALQILLLPHSLNLPFWNSNYMYVRHHCIFYVCYLLICTCFILVIFFWSVFQFTIYLTVFSLYKPTHSELLFNSKISIWFIFIISSYLSELSIFKIILEHGKHSYFKVPLNCNIFSPCGSILLSVISPSFH